MGILTIQLLVTTLVCLAPMLSDSFKNFQLKNLGLLWTCLALNLVSCFAVVCYKSLARKVPTNYILLSIFTLTESYIVSFICSTYDSNTVLMAAIMTVGMTTAITLYAVTTKKDFTMMGGSLFIFAMAFLLFAIFMIFMPYNPVLDKIYCVLGVVLYGFYLIYDV